MKYPHIVYQDYEKLRSFKKRGKFILACIKEKTMSDIGLEFYQKLGDKLIFSPYLH